ncbi:MAG: hypothetical protein O7H41_20355 [Planctomycetota bacterium]|nr:hypothetical protein [Planctomycetota bacterium]
MAEQGQKSKLLTGARLRARWGIWGFLLGVAAGFGLGIWVARYQAQKLEESRLEMVDRWSGNASSVQEGERAESNQAAGAEVPEVATIDLEPIVYDDVRMEFSGKYARGKLFYEFTLGGPDALLEMLTQGGRWPQRGIAPIAIFLLDDQGFPVTKISLPVHKLGPSGTVGSDNPSVYYQGLEEMGFDEARVVRMWRCSIDKALMPAARRQMAVRNETAAIGALRTVSSVQAQFREGDREGDSTLDYATSMAELSNVGLIDSVLGGGKKSGYVFTLSGSTYEWMCKATPMSDRTGKRNFIVCVDGVIRFSSSGVATCTSGAVD